MIRFVIIFFAIVLSNFSQAQEVKINWKILDTNIGLNIGSQYYADGKLNTVISRSSYSGTPQIINVNYINIDTLVFTDEVKASLSSDFKFNWGKSRDEYILDVNFNPLIISGGQKKLVSSFTVLVDDKVITESVLLKKTNVGFAVNSVLSAGDWVKLSINKTGVFQIDYNLMQEITSAMGRNLEDINPENISIYGNNGGMLNEVNSEYISDDLVELAIQVEGEEDLKFDANDRIVFYAEGADEIKFKRSLYIHKKNIYTDKTYVFVTINDKKGNRVKKLKSVNEKADYKISTYEDVQFHDLENINILHSGQNWVGEDFDVEKNVSVKFNFPNRILDKPVLVKSKIIYANGGVKELGLSVNKTLLYTYKIPDKYPGYYGRKTNSSNYNGAGSELNVTFNYSAPSGEKLYLDYLLLIAESKLKATGNQLSFRNSMFNNALGVKEYSISNESKLKEVWNVTNALNPTSVNITREGDVAKFKMAHDKIAEFVILSGNEYYKPELIGKVANQNLHFDKAVNYIIVSDGDFMAPAKNLANYHEGKGLKVKVVDVDDIYNEFSAGRQDLVAIRQYVRMIYEKSIGTKSELKYLLMFGDASYDFKDRVEDNTNIVPSYQVVESFSETNSFVTDDFFGVMDASEGGNITSRSNVVDIAIGRIPVHEIEDAENAVAKIIGYNTVETYGAWRNNVQFVVDDATAEDGWEVELFRDVEGLSANLKSTLGTYNHQKIYLDTYKPIVNAGLVSYPKAHVDLMQNLQGGNLVTNYSGHGNEFEWTGNGLFDGINDVENLTNNNNLPLFITITCEFSRYDNPDIKYSGGDKLLSYAYGGGIGLISTTRKIGPTAGGALHKSVLEHLFTSEEKKTIGEALRLAKNAQLAYSSRRTISYLGDPALMLAYPKDEVVLTKVNEKEIGSETDTIKSLMHVSIEGEIRKQGVINSGFNGEVSTVLFDKVDYRKSLNNNNVKYENPIVDYWIQDNVVYKGRSSVKAGKFTADFIIPKDINYSVGNGKISFYAKSNLTDATGFNSEIKVGGVSDELISDEIGPEIDVYINNKLFADGGMTNSTPILVVDLTDASGINTVGNGIGHDLSVTVRKDGESEKIKLNANYQSQLDDFTKGKAKYEFLGLEQGLYELEISAWDVYNNSSYKKISFVVQDDNKLIVSEIVNFPNPFKDYTTFSFTHNKTDDILSISIEIYSTSAQLVKTIMHNKIYDGFVAQDIKWDGISDTGSKLNPGIYYYRIIVKTIEGKVSNSDVGKLIMSL
ncbi:MAG: type IX secretion system sortase PorU [Ichthyobacteriaceae bacterium]|nr:type IX secretion system sortase PorU [Ichthyobacteriaceae bacterium]